MIERLPPHEEDFLANFWVIPKRINLKIHRVCKRRTKKVKPEGKKRTERD